MAAAAAVADALTQNGALTHSTTGTALVDFFSMMTRDIASDVRTDLLKKAWGENPLLIMKLIFHLFDCRGGKKERYQGEQCLLWLLENHRDDLMANFEHIWFYGYWKSYLIFLGTDLEGEMISFYADAIKRDLAIVSADTAEKKGDLNQLTLAGKWLPRENGAHDKRFAAAKKFAKALGKSMKQYRTDVLNVLTPHLHVVETKMCAGKWTEIDYEKVTSIAGKRYEKAFPRHDEDGYIAYREKVKAGQAKMNTSQNFAHEFVGPYIHRRAMEPDEDIEVRWSQYLKQTVERVRQHYTDQNKRMRNMLVVADVSESMYRGCRGIKVPPIDVSVGLAMLGGALLPEESPFHRKWMTFSADPQLHATKGETLFDQVQDAQEANWGMNTNLQKMFDLVLTMATSLSVPQEHLPEMFVIISDMEFDKATRSNDRTNVEAYKQKFVDAGYTPPDVVFWNVNASSVQFPATDNAPGVSLVSGFSPDLFTSLLEEGEMTPYQMMYRVATSPRYNRISVAPATYIDIEGFQDLAIGSTSSDANDEA